MRSSGLLAAASVLALASAAVPGDLVTSLPNFQGGNFPTIYSGYLNIPGGKHLHYIFSEATAVDPAKAPVVLWTNGGPGCSSLEGFFNEGGILSLSDNGVLTINPYSWNNITSGLYLEQPAGVGFSYADTVDGLIHNDTSTAQDNLAAIVAFFDAFPEYKANDFYLSGESYAGIYVPMMGQAVVAYNQQTSSPDQQIKLKGILVGNGCLGTEIGVCGDDFSANGLNIDQWRGHGLISYNTYQQVQQFCDWSNPTSACQKALNQAAAEVGNIDIYDIYDPECINNQASSSSVASMMRFNNMTTEEAAARIRAGYVLTEPVQHYNKVPISKARKMLYQAMGYTESGPSACIDAGGLPVYLNTVAVRQALHVVDDLKYYWTICSSNLSYTPTMQDERVQVYPDIINSGARVLIYNGEADACVPFEDNERWTSSMNYSVVSPWHAWMVNPANVGGYATVYTPQNTSIHGQFQFVTVRGAGHMVPQVRPEAAWVMFNNFLSGKIF